MAKDLPNLHRRFVVTGGAGLASLALARAMLSPRGRSAQLARPPGPNLAGVPTPAYPSRVPATARTSLPAGLDPALMAKALAAYDSHAQTIRLRDKMILVDFSAPSSAFRMHFLDVMGGKASSLLVAHGSGSDPSHTGFLERFSNVPGSNASSKGAFVTDEYYIGKHGRSQRLRGLDGSNSNALARAIVIHSAWYANEDMLRSHGMLGRSQGCFAVGEGKLDAVFDFLGKGRMLYAGRA